VKRIAAGGAAAIAALLLAATPLGANLWSLATARGFFVPPESSLFTFHVTRQNDGSGEWWSHGADQRYLYALHAERPVYLRAERGAQQHCAGFVPLDSTTWCGALERPLPGR
jgi:hypothetical protein